MGWATAAAVPVWPLRRNSPFWPVGRLKPGRLSGLTCCWARSGGSWALINTTVGEALPLSCVTPKRAAPVPNVIPSRTTLLLKSWVAFMRTVPPACTTAFSELDASFATTTFSKKLAFFTTSGASVLTPLLYVGNGGEKACSPVSEGTQIQPNVVTWLDSRPFPLVA
ncbi:hypothetical protein ALQ15_200025 [Pseudomonas syringae pv. actinidiae]|uniref:Uncharacterized protein n=1 Tax=Pseudomonas syringae pv. actinidiae TaxID=103796 RepID=A0A7Z6UAJ0_PSESF|nr:hypothetical protein ALQ15_200025 [Pseudomonas syringae pv. actinidiae]